MYVRFFFLLFCQFLTALACLGQCSFLKGQVVNATNQAGLSVNFSIKLNGVRKNMGKSDDNGAFSIQIPCEATHLVVEKQGFRSLTMPISGNTDAQIYFCDLVLFPVDKQASDRPYFQSEQKDMVLDNAKPKSDKKSIRYFKLIDIQTKTPLNGEVCLYFTQTGKKPCLNIEKASLGEKVIFEQEDIVGLVAKSDGYQVYNGQLTIEQLDNVSSTYEIALSKMNSLLVFSVKMPSVSDKMKVDIIDQKQNKIAYVAVDSHHGFVNLLAGANYKIKVTNTADSKSAEQVIEAKDGLNFVLLPANTVESKPAQREKITPPIPVLTEKPTQLPAHHRWVIYFQQSNYDLLAEAKVVLDTVTNLLLKNPLLKIQVTGFTDNRGDAQLNNTLSEFRARVTVNHLLTHGVSESQLTWKAMGSSHPAVANDNETTKYLNRRVEIITTN